MESSARFVRQGDYTVVDGETGLEWQLRPSDDPMVWKDGVAYVETLNKNRFGGHSDWRLPSTNELKSLIAPEEDGTTGLFVDKIFGFQKCFWTGTETDHQRHRAAYADFYYGDMYVMEENYADFYIRAVRSLN